MEVILKIEWSMMAPFLCTLISNTQRKVLYQRCIQNLPKHITYTYFRIARGSRNHDVMIKIIFLQNTKILVLLER